MAGWLRSLDRLPLVVPAVSRRDSIEMESISSCEAIDLPACQCGCGADDPQRVLGDESGRQSPHRVDGRVECVIHFAVRVVPIASNGEDESGR